MKWTHFRSEEVKESISSSRQSESTNQENGEHQVRECGCYVHSLKHADTYSQKLNVLYVFMMKNSSPLIFIIFKSLKEDLYVSQANRPFPWTEFL